MMKDSEFNDIVSKAAEEKSTSILPNSSANRAACVMINIFKTSEKYIKLFVGALDSKITENEEYLKELKSAVHRGVSIEVLYCQKPNNESPANKLLNEIIATSSKVHKYTFSPEIKELIDKKKFNNEKSFYFAVSDDRMYRFETDTSEHLAWFCFNDEAKAKTLTDLFNSMIKLSPEYSA